MSRCFQCGRHEKGMASVNGELMCHTCLIALTPREEIFHVMNGEVGTAEFMQSKMPLRILSVSWQQEIDGAQEWTVETRGGKLTGVLFADAEMADKWPGTVLRLTLCKSLVPQCVDESPVTAYLLIPDMPNIPPHRPGTSDGEKYQHLV